MNTGQTSRAWNVVVATVLTFFGSLLAVAPAIVLVGLAEMGEFANFTGFPIPRPETRFLWISIPALFFFVALSRTFPRWPALWTNSLFATFVAWRGDGAWPGCLRLDGRMRDRPG